MSDTAHESGLNVLRGFLGNAPEVTVFMTCCAMVNELRSLDRAFRVGEIKPTAFRERYEFLRGQLAGAAATTERFDLVLPVLDQGQFAPSFWRWYNWWNDFFKTLTPAQIGEIGRLARERAPEVEAHRPGGRWWEHRPAPAF